MKVGKTRRHPAGLIARIVVLVLIACAPLLPSLEVPSEERSVVYVIDRSASVSQEESARAEAFVREAARGDAEVGIVVFDATPELVVKVGGRMPRKLELESEVAGSDVVAALRLAGAALPDAGERRVVLLSDARATDGDVVAAAERLAAEGIEVDTVPIGDAAPGQAMITDVAPTHSRVSKGEAVELSAQVWGPAGKRVEVHWFRGPQMLGSSEATIGEDGRATVTWTDASPPAGVMAYQAVLDGGRGLARIGRTAVMVTGGKKALLVSRFETGLIKDALEKAEMEVTELDPESEPLDKAKLEDTDLVVLVDMPLPRAGEISIVQGLDETQQALLVEYVREQSGGLMVTGGGFGFAPEYADTPLARLLPVEIEDRGDIIDPEVALAIMLDRSGSMSATVGDGDKSKMDLAVEAAVAATTTLRPRDRVAVAAIDEMVTWYQPLAFAAEVATQRKRIRAITAGGGGIYVYTTMVAAYDKLKDAPEPIRHVILFSDTADSEEQSQGCPFGPCYGEHHSAIDLAREAKTAGITTSVVGIGNSFDSDTPFLQDLAAAGGGRFYLTSDGNDLRSIFVAETRAAARTNLHEASVSVVVGDPSPILTGVDVSAIPPLTGYVETRRRVTADTALLTEEGHPLVASWRYGLGRVTALTSDAGGLWTKDWEASPEVAKLLRQMARYAARRHGGTASDAELSLSGNQATLTVTLPDDMETAKPGAAEIIAVDEDGKEIAVPAVLERVAPNRYRATAPVTSPVAFARVRAEDGTLMAETLGHQASAAELAEVGANRQLLTEIARRGQGSFEPSPADTMRATATSRPHPMPLWPYLLLLAGCILAADLFLRRLEPKARAAEAGAPEKEDAPKAADDAPLDAAA